MRASCDPALGAGIGQFFLTTAAAYRQSGGHAAISSSIHEGLHLSRLYRRAGLRTDLADLTPLAECRMYHGARPTWHGLAKNAHEGLGAWKVIFPMTLLLTLGQIAPFALLLAALFRPTPPPLVLTVAASPPPSPGPSASPPPSVSASPGSAPPSTPSASPALLGIQWWARLRHSLGLRTTWKGRSY